MSSFEHFTDLDEVVAFGDYLVERGAIPQGGFLHLRTKPVKEKRNKWAWGKACQDAFSHAAKLSDKYPEHYRAFKTLRRLTT